MCATPKKKSDLWQIYNIIILGHHHHHHHHATTNNVYNIQHLPKVIIYLCMYVVYSKKYALYILYTHTFSNIEKEVFLFYIIFIAPKYCLFNLFT